MGLSKPCQGSRGRDTGPVRREACSVLRGPSSTVPPARPHTPPTPASLESSPCHHLGRGLHKDAAELMEREREQERERELIHLLVVHSPDGHRPGLGQIECRNSSQVSRVDARSWPFFPTFLGTLAWIRKESSWDLNHCSLIRGCWHCHTSGLTHHTTGPTPTQWALWAGLRSEA